MATHTITKDESGYTFSVTNLVIKDGNEGEGKILVSDSYGLASWKHPASYMGAFEHYVGEIYGGGIVFDVWKEGDDEKVLIASLTDLDPSGTTTYAWGSNSVLTGSTSPSNGKSNTEKVQTSGAALICKEYRKFSTPLSYTFSSSTVAGDPGAGFFRYRTITGFIYINNLDTIGNNRSSVINKWAFVHQAGTQMGKIIISDQLTGSKIGYYTVFVSSNNPNPIVQNTGYLTIETSNYTGTTPIDNRRYILTFEYGEQGDVEYDDWYLPSTFEFKKLLNSAAIINRILGDKNGIKFINAAVGVYWTSTEVSTTNAYTVYMDPNNHGRITSVPKTNSYYIRAIRLAETKKSNGLVLDLDITNNEKLEETPTRIQESTLLQNGVSLALNSYFIFSNGVGYLPYESGYVTFDGTNQYLDFSAPLGNTTTVCVEMWARLKSDYGGGPTRMMFGWNNYDVWCTTSGIGFNTGTGDQYGITTAQVNSNELVNNWKHYVFEMNFATQSGNKIYINGMTQSLSKIFTNEPNTTNMNFNSGLGRISGWRANTTYPASMDVSLFRVYNRRLTSDEVFRNFDNSKRKYEILPTVVKNDLVLHLDADNTSSYNGSSATWYDISGKGNNSTAFVNSPTFNKPTTVYPGGYISFDGINEKIEFPNISRLNSGLDFYTDGNFSWEAWIYCVQDATIKNQMFMGVSGTPYLSFYSDIYYENSASNNYGNKIFINIRTTGGIQFYHFTKKTLSFDRWYHVVVTQKFDGTNTTQRIYVDGVEDQQDTVAEYGSSSEYITVRPFNSIPGKILNYVFNPAGSNVGKLAIGDGAVNGEQYGGAAAYSPFKGNIAQVRLYRKALSAAEIKNNYNATKHKFDLGNDTHGYNTHRLDTTGSTNPTFSITQNLNIYVGNINTASKYQSSSFIGSESSAGHLIWKRSGIPKMQKDNTLYPNTFIGEANFGGIVVGRLPRSEYILLASVKDISTSQVWSTNSASISTTNHDGKSNTLAIAFTGGVANLNTAAYLCTQYTTAYESTTGNYMDTDWYLPSLYEMLYLYNSAKIINNILGDSAVGTTHHGLSGTYWTSTQYEYHTLDGVNSTGAQAYTFNFDTGLVGIDYKNVAYKVRAVRTLKLKSLYE